MAAIVKRIRGQDLYKNVGENVIILGKVGMVSPSSKSIELVTTDDVKVNVSLPEPFDGNHEGYLEVYGAVQSKTTVLCDSYAVFSLEDNLNFSSDNYNELLTVSNLLGDKKWKFDEEGSIFA